MQKRKLEPYETIFETRSVELYKDVIAEINIVEKYGDIKGSGEFYKNPGKNRKLMKYTITYLYVYEKFVDTLFNFLEKTSIKDTAEYLKKYWGRDHYINKYDELVASEKKKKLVIPKKDVNLIRASLLAGLNLFGQPNYNRAAVKKIAKKLDVDISKYEVNFGSGLAWSLPDIVKNTASRMIEEMLDSTGEETTEEDLLNWGDFSYFFNLVGEGTPADEDIINAIKKLGLIDDKIYIFTAENSTITVITFDFKNTNEFLKFIKYNIKNIPKNEN